VKRSEEGTDENAYSGVHVIASHRETPLIIAPRGLFTSDGEYRAAVRKREVVEGWVRWVRQFHWDLFITPSFADAVSDDYARLAAEEYATAIGSVGAFIAWGGGQSHSCHALVNLGNAWDRRRPRSGIDRRALTIRRIERKWKHGGIEVERYDARGATKAVRYFADHHEVELIGEPLRHRVRR
jgi:hypothetical protein